MTEEQKKVEELERRLFEATDLLKRAGKIIITLLKYAPEEWQEALAPMIAEADLFLK